MLKPRLRFFFNLILAIFSGCQYLHNSDQELLFTVIDAGQGLSQIAQLNRAALVWDMGPEQCINEWFNVYRRAGRPRLEAVVISHRDLDHSGGLQFLDSTVDWSGIIVASKHEDTSYIRSLCKRWTKKITIRVVCDGDTLGYLPETYIRCLWPPSELIDSFPVQSTSINRYSLVFRVNFGGTDVLISSDIDSSAAVSIALIYKESLASDILVVPHHGSAGSLNRVFIGYTNPEFCVISCAKNNQYNHPAEPVVSFLRTMGANLRITYLDRSVGFKSNGFYWSEY